MIHSETAEPQPAGPSSAGQSASTSPVSPIAESSSRENDRQEHESVASPIALDVAQGPPSEPSTGEQDDHGIEMVPRGQSAPEKQTRTDESPAQQPQTLPPPAAVVSDKPADPSNETSRDIEAQSIRPTGQSDRQATLRSKTRAVAAESVAKFIASGLHFGLARQYAEFAFGQLIAEKAQDEPSAAAIIGNPRARAALTALFAVGVLASAHHIGEIYIRPLVMRLLGAQVDPTDATSAFPDDATAADRMVKQQTAGKIGKASADLPALLSFGIAHGIRGALGGSSKLAASLTSGIGGGTMAALHATMNLHTHTHGSHDDSVVPTHHATTSGVPSMRDLGDVAAKSFKSIAGDGPIKDQVANTLHDILVVRGIASLQGLIISDMVKAQMANVQAGKDLSGGQQFGQTSAATVALLGLGFWANLSLAERRGKTSERMSGTIGALKSLDPIKAADNGGMRALMEAKNTGAGARAWNAALSVVDVTAHATKTFQALPAHLALDALTMVGRELTRINDARASRRSEEPQRPTEAARPEQTLHILEDANVSGTPYSSKEPISAEAKIQPNRRAAGTSRSR